MNRVAALQSQVGAGGCANNVAVGDIVVLGACFLDYIAYVDAFPRPGETIPCDNFAKGFGGKGANQAVAAGLLGGRVRMVSVVGSDGDGDAYILNFQEKGIDTRHVAKVPKQSTGIALIAVDKKAENTIVICPNAVRTFTRSALGAMDFLQGCRILICQNEIPLDASLAAMEAAHKRGIYTIFNTAGSPSPAQVKQMLPYFKYVSLVCPNETELLALTGMETGTVEAAMKATDTLRRTSGVRDIVVTLGSRGHIVAEQGKTAQHVAAGKVVPVDTTGAGDCFVGAMARFLHLGNTLTEACRKASFCASLSVTRKGTQSSYPTKSEIPADFF